MIGAAVASVLRQIRDYENSEGYMPKVWYVGPLVRARLDADVRKTMGYSGDPSHFNARPPHLTGLRLLGVEILP